MKFRCWSPEQFGEEECDAEEVNACDAEDAAADYAEKRHDDDPSEWPGDIDVLVRDENGAVHQCSVTTDYSPSFSGALLKHGPKKPYQWELELHERWKVKAAGGEP